MKDAVVGAEKDAVVVEEEEEEKDVVAAGAAAGTRFSSIYPNLYSHHPCECHRLCAREECNSRLKEDTKSP